MVGDDLEDAKGEREDAVDRAQGEDPEVVPFPLHGGFAVQVRVDLPPVVVVDVDDLGWRADVLDVSSRLERRK